jgi:transcriptional regulator with XRE-family HTH domain
MNPPKQNIEILLAAKWSQADIARESRKVDEKGEGISTATISRILSGDVASPSFANALILHNLVLLASGQNLSPLADRPTSAAPPGH